MMKQMNATKRTTKVVSLLLTLCLVISMFSVTVYGDDTAINKQPSTDSTEATLLEGKKLFKTLESNIYQNSHEEQKYVEDEVLIGIADNETTRSMSFCAVYSDDYQTINKNEKERNLNNVAAEPVETIAKQLNIDLDFTEMTLLNPSADNRDRSGKYQIDGKNNNIYCIKLDGETVDDAIEELSANPLIRYAHPNYLREVNATPDDAYYGFQTEIEKMNLPQAWNTTTGSKNVVVGIIDSGLDGTHYELKSNLWTNPYNPNGNVCLQCGRVNDIHGYNFSGAGNNGVAVGGTPTCVGDHGTHVAGIIGAVGNNRLGVCGVNWNVSLAWLGCAKPDKPGTCESRHIISAIYYAEEHGIPILNCSLGSEGYAEGEFEAISNYSGLVIAAAGNETQDLDHAPVYPACYECPNIISVASVDINGNLSDFSNYGKLNVDVAAPGEDILSTIGNNDFAYNSGTSMAAPQVAGIAALIKAAHPTYSTQQIKAAICGTVQQQGKTYNIACDGGIVDAAAAVAVTSSSLKRITFNYNYSGAPSSIVDYVVSGQKATEPLNDPQRSNYVFEGWYTSSSGTTPFNFNSPIYSNTTIYAKWTEKSNLTYGSLFPDYRFRNEVLRLVNARDNGSRTSISSILDDMSYLISITSLDISGKKIRNIIGVEYFSGLKDLNCSNNYIKGTLSTPLYSLESLDCSKNQINELTISYPAGLKDLDCSYNNFSSLSTSMLTNLTHLDCSNNRLSSLTTNTALEQLNCSYNQLTELNVTALTNMTHLDCSNNCLSLLTTNNALEHLNCSYNELFLLNVTASTNMTHLDCSNNYLVSLTTNTALEHLNCNYNALMELNVEASTDLGTLYCKSNNLYVINTIGLDELENVDVSLNHMNAKNDVIGYDNWDLSPSLFHNVFEPQQPWKGNPFTDVASDSYYYKAVQYGYENVYLVGADSDTFSANDTISRMALVIMLYFMAGQPDVSNLSMPFTDVPDLYIYADPIKWAYNNGNQVIMGGTSSTTFDPYALVTRETVATVLARYAARYDLPLRKLRDYVPFADNAQISSWARTPVIELYEAGVLNGSPTYYYPKNNITRADLSVILRKFNVITKYI